MARLRRAPRSRRGSARRARARGRTSARARARDRGRGAARSKSPRLNRVDRRREVRLAVTGRERPLERDPRAARAARASLRITHAWTAAYASAREDRRRGRRVLDGLLEQLRGGLRVRAPEPAQLGARAQVEIDRARIGRARSRRSRASTAPAAIPRASSSLTTSTSASAQSVRCAQIWKPSATPIRRAEIRRPAGVRRSEPDDDVIDLELRGRARADRRRGARRTSPPGARAAPRVVDSVSIRSSSTPSARYSSPGAHVERQHRDRGLAGERRRRARASACGCGRGTGARRVRRRGRDRADARSRDRGADRRRRSPADRADRSRGTLRRSLANARRHRRARAGAAAAVACATAIAIGVVAGPRPRAGRELVQHHAEREQIGARVDVAPGELLGRHVARRADHRADLRDARHRRRARDAEVGDHDATVAALDQHVVGLEIAVDDARRVRRREPRADLHRRSRCSCAPRASACPELARAAARRRRAPSSGTSRRRARRCRTCARRCGAGSAGPA